ncbi:EAL domain-containing protein [Herbaspirillum huttiense]|uniref:EAL domain-containing protein n=4 Tax=root TaxID=1 RepID=A0AAJ2H7I9_9BURK|nr:EAL domain-containing protein [Herbaspirillum huttiense]MDR9837023.1 EAL domain-containing protein [Herbaspirillum huttiense]
MTIQPIETTPGASLTRLLPILGALATVAMIAIAAMQLSAAKSDELDRLNRELRLLSQTVSRQLSVVLRSDRVVIDETAKTLALWRNEQGKDITASELQVLNSHLAASDVSALFVYDAAGRLIGQAGIPLDATKPRSPSPILLQPGARKYFEGQAAIADHLSTSEAPLDAQGHYSWLITTWIDIRSIERTMAAFNAGGPKYRLAILDGSGRVLTTYPDNVEVNQDQLRSAALETWVFGSESSTPEQYRLFFPKSLSTINSVAGSTLLVSADIDPTEANDRLRRKMIVVVLLGAFSISALWALIIYLRRQLLSQVSSSLLAVTAEERLSTILSRLADNILILDHYGQILFASVPEADALGIRNVPGLTGQTIASALPAPILAQLLPAIRQLEDPHLGAVDRTGIALAENGEQRHFEMRVERIAEDPAGGYVASFRDNTIHVKYAESLAQAANLDPATNLPTLHTFVDRLNLALPIVLREDSVLAVMALHLPITAEPLAADILPALIADRLKAIIADVYSLAADGPGKFYIVFRKVDEPIDLVGLATEFLTAYDTPFIIDGSEITVRCRVGIALYPIDGSDALTLIREANDAINNTDSTLRVSFYNHAVTNQIMRLHKATADLEHSLKTHGISVTYRPVVRLGSEDSIGAYAVVSATIDGQLRAVTELLPLLHEANITLFSDQQVVDTVAQDILNESTLPSTFFIQVTASSLFKPEFSKTVTDAVSKLSRDTKLALVISELEATEHKAGISEAIAHIKRVGAKLYLGEFGTGLASLTLISELGLDGLILDWSLIADDSIAPEDFAMITACSAACRTLNMELGIDGIRGQDVHDTLCNLGLHFATGSYFGKPLSAPEFFENLVLQKTHALRPWIDT